MKMRIEGLKQVDEALKDLPKATAKGVVRRVLRRRAEPMAMLTARLAPVDTSDLANSIEITTRLTPRQRRYQRSKGDNIGADAVVLYVGSSSPVAHLQEFGTRHHAAQPFMRPAFEQLKYRVLDGIQKDLMNEIEKAKARQARKAARIARRQALGLE